MGIKKAYISPYIPCAYGQSDVAIGIGINMALLLVLPSRLTLDRYPEIGFCSSEVSVVYYLILHT
jgi:hypothetical protein